MAAKTDYHKANRECDKTDDGLTLLEEAVILAYTRVKETMGRKGDSLIAAGYSPYIDDFTPKDIVDRIANTVFNKDKVRKRLSDILRDRDGSFIYDKVMLQEAAVELLGMAKKEKNLPVMKNTIEMMMKNLGMLNGTEQKAGAARGSSKRAKSAFDKRRKNLTVTKFPVKKKNKQG